MKTFFSLSLLILPFFSFAQLPPGSEIYLLDLLVKGSGIQVSNPNNITNRVGYDNQPFFHPEKTIVYYSSAYADGRTDLFEFNYETHQARNITASPEREYSPTVTLDKKFISCIIQRDNGAQDLGKYPIDGGDPIILIDNLIVGYHAWIDKENLLLFVLGDTLTLHQYNLTTKKDVIIANTIGRSLHKIPKTTSMSFVHKISEKEWVIKKINENGTQEIIATTLTGREDLTWTPDGKILASDGKDLFFFQPGKTSGWNKIEMPASMPRGTISRLTVNSVGNKIALVVSE